ncbi:hypothetical protein RhiirA5_444378 [Rhizophagus irregularis]|uniref:Uncharacterized protein n=1 Tax=Rhizophagus irregularis TaxID=588596 RepID=A0A2N0ND60_9GLOM|nr:hypothetical protein RhiirA5_444378 [Rhizophagus irregularis]
MNSSVAIYAIVSRLLEVLSKSLIFIWSVWVEVISIYVDICGFLFQKSSVEKDCRDDNLVISNNSNRNTLAVEIYKKFERAMK